MVENRKKSPINKQSRILGDRTFAAITAVEGLALSAASKKRLATMKAKKLTPAQKRAEVLRAYRHNKVR
jgi:hypothetical protein